MRDPRICVPSDAALGCGGTDACLGTCRSASRSPVHTHGRSPRLTRPFYVLLRGDHSFLSRPPGVLRFVKDGSLLPQRLYITLVHFDPAGLLTGRSIPLRSERILFVYFLDRATHTQRALVRANRRGDNASRQTLLPSTSLAVSTMRAPKFDPRSGFSTGDGGPGKTAPTPRTPVALGRCFGSISLTSGIRIPQAHVRAETGRAEIGPRLRNPGLFVDSTAGLIYSC